MTGAFLSEGATYRLQVPAQGRRRHLCVRRAAGELPPQSAGGEQGQALRRRSDLLQCPEQPGKKRESERCRQERCKELVGMYVQVQMKRASKPKGAARVA